MAPILGGVRLTGFACPSDSTDVYPVIDNTYGIGGFREVADIPARDGITSERRRLGMLVYVLSDNNTYQLRTGLTNSDWILFSTGSGVVSVPATRVPFGDSSSQITSSPNLVWNDASQFLQIPNLVLSSHTLGPIAAGKIEFDGTDLYFSTSALNRQKVMLADPDISTYSITNGTVQRSLNAQDLTLDDLGNILSTLIADLRRAKIVL